MPLGVGARVMVRSNIDITDKIFNGVYGTVKYINLHKNQNASGPKSDNSVSAKAVDLKVFIKFDNNQVGKKIKHTCSQFCRPHCQLIGTVPIAPLEKQYKGKEVRKTNVRLKRFQLPLTLCWAFYHSQISGCDFTKGLY